MAALRCAGAGRALLRTPGLLQRVACVGQRPTATVLQQQPVAALLPSSSRYYGTYLAEYEKKELAVALMKERDPHSEIDNLDELLDLLKANKGYCSDKQSVQAAVARAAIEDKKHELVSLLLRSDGGHEYSKKMEELVAAARLRRESLVIEDLKQRVKFLEEKLFLVGAFWGFPLTVVAVFGKWIF